MNALEICGISVICVEKNIQLGYFHADLADLADFLFRYYYLGASIYNKSVLFALPA